MKVGAIVPVPPHADFAAEVAAHPLVAGIRLNTVMPIEGSPSAVMMRAALLDAVGLFDESYPACEDYELWLRVSRARPVGLLPERLLVKYGGHPDQLSSTTLALDRLRIRAIVKTLENEPLTTDQRSEALASLRTKCPIYAQGCRKRGRESEALEILALPERYAAP